MNDSNDGQGNNKDVLTILREFSLRRNIAAVRTAVNDKLDLASSTARRFSPDALGDVRREYTKSHVMDPLYTVSEYCQAEFPWVSTVVRSHYVGIITTTGAAAGLVGLYRSKCN
jgi:hypothetical protein